MHETVTHEIGKLHNGKDGNRTETGFAYQVVLDMVNDVRLQGKGYVVVMDNFYSSPSLFRDLMDSGFGACGTVRKDRKGLSQDVCTVTLRRGEVTSTVDDSMLGLKWKNKRDVLMLSTYHNSSMVTKTRQSRAAVGGVEDIQKPKVVEDYNQNMGGVDKSKLVSIVHLHFISYISYRQADDKVLWILPPLCEMVEEGLLPNTRRSPHQQLRTLQGCNWVQKDDTAEIQTVCG